MILQHQVVRDRNIRVSNIANPSQTQFPRVRIGAVGNELMNIDVIPAHISCKISQDTRCCNDAQTVRRSIAMRRAASNCASKNARSNS